MNIPRRKISKTGLTFTCGVLLLSAVVFYLYFLNMSVVQVVLRTELISEQRALEAEIASLDAEYIKAQHAVTSLITSLDGYNTENNKIFVSRGESRLVMQD